MDSPKNMDLASMSSEPSPSQENVLEEIITSNILIAPFNDSPSIDEPLTLPRKTI